MYGSCSQVNLLAYLRPYLNVGEKGFPVRIYLFMESIGCKEIPYRTPLGLATRPGRRVGPQLKPEGNQSFAPRSLGPAGARLYVSTTLAGPMCRLALAGHKSFVAGPGGWE